MIKETIKVMKVEYEKYNVYGDNGPDKVIDKLKPQ